MNGVQFPVLPKQSLASSRRRGIIGPQLRGRGEDSAEVSRIPCNSALGRFRVTVAGETMRLGEGVSLSGSLDPSGLLRDRVVIKVYPCLTATQVIGIDRVQLATELGENGKKSEKKNFTYNTKTVKLSQKTLNEKVES